MSSKSTALGHLVPVPLKFMFIYLHREKHIKNMVEWLEFQTATTLKQGIQIYFCRSNNYAALELSFFSPWMVGSICHLAWLVVPEQAIRSHSFVHPQVCWWNPRLLLIWNLDPRFVRIRFLALFTTFHNPYSSRSMVGNSPGTSPWWLRYQPGGHCSQA